MGILFAVPFLIIMWTYVIWLDCTKKKRDERLRILRRQERLLEKIETEKIKTLYKEKLEQKKNKSSIKLEKFEF